MFVGLFVCSFVLFVCLFVCSFVVVVVVVVVVFLVVVVVDVVAVAAAVAVAAVANAMYFEESLLLETPNPLSGILLRCGVRFRSKFAPRQGLGGGRAYGFICCPWFCEPL